MQYDIQSSCAYADVMSFVNFGQAYFMGWYMSIFISGVFMYFSSLFVLAYGRLYLLNNVQYLIVMMSANKNKNPKNIKIYETLNPQNLQAQMQSYTEDIH